jgi:UDP-N-acetylmuramoyl-tripeptide--D-alanyl-D-alanine ligase
MKALASVIAGWCGGRLLGPDVMVEGVSQDSRQLPPGGLFVALPGERRHGHDFVAAVAGTAGAALVEREQNVDLTQIVVDNAELALQRIASAWLAQISPTVAALTGSNGKTTTKTLTAAILARVDATHATPGNYNNEIGVPLTLLGLQPEHRYAVVEMGCGKPGDIDLLAAIAPPHAAVVTNVGAAHLERLGSLTGVAEAKAGIYRGLRPEGIAIINADDAYADYFRTQAGVHPCVDFAIDAAAAFRAEALVISQVSRFRLCTPAGSCAIELPLPGRHNVMNALAAAALAQSVGASLNDIAEALATVEAVSGRLRRLQLQGGVLYDDSYNANPGSLAAAIGALALEPPPRWLILGDMAELGPEAPRWHADCGRLARDQGIERLYTCGSLSQAAAQAYGSQASHHSSIESLIDTLRADWRPGITALVKGSRSARMERVVAGLSGNNGGHH